MNDLTTSWVGQRGDLELYVPRTMADFVTSRNQNVAKAIEFMAGLYRDGALH